MGIFFDHYEEVILLNETINTILRRRSIRVYKLERIKDEKLD